MASVLSMIVPSKSNNMPSKTCSSLGAENDGSSVNDPMMKYYVVSRNRVDSPTLREGRDLLAGRTPCLYSTD